MLKIISSYHLPGSSDLYSNLNQKSSTNPLLVPTVNLASPEQEKIRVEMFQEEIGDFLQEERGDWVQEESGDRMLNEGSGGRMLNEESGQRMLNEGSGERMLPTGSAEWMLHQAEKRKLTHEIENIKKKLKEAILCSVCHKVPRSERIPICRNGHVSCEGCFR